jgi:hypothetical protein
MLGFAFRSIFQFSVLGMQKKLSVNPAHKEQQERARFAHSGEQTSVMAADLNNVFLISMSPWATSTPKKTKIRPRKSSASPVDQLSSAVQRLSKEVLAVFKAVSPEVASGFAGHADTSIGNNDHAIDGAIEVTASAGRGLPRARAKNKRGSPSFKSRKPRVNGAQPKEVFICTHCGNSTFFVL